MQYRKGLDVWDRAGIIIVMCLLFIILLGVMQNKYTEYRQKDKVWELLGGESR